MAAVRLIALHASKGRSVARCLEDRTDYAKNPEKTQKGELVTAYGCDPITVDEEFMLQKRLYFQITGKAPRHDVIAYQIRQSFKPGEITPEEANRLGHELAMRFTKGRYSFIVATHTDRAHVHNHIVYNSTAMDGSRKFKNFWFSGIALQHLSDLICLENGLSVITPAPYSEREKRTTFPKRENIRTGICRDIDRILKEKPKDFTSFLKSMEAAGYEIKTGKQTAVKGKNQKTFIRLDSLNEGYRESDIREIIAGTKQHSGKSRTYHQRRPMNLLIDIQRKMQEKGAGYARWATVYNLKQMKRDSLLASIQASEKRLAEIAALKKHIINYSKTRCTYEAYRKAGYSKKFFEAHREELTIHKAAKQAFDELGVRKIPKVKELSAEYAEILSGKKAAYAKYRKVRDEAQELAIAERNIASLYEAERNDEQDRQPEEKAH